MNPVQPFDLSAYDYTQDDASHAGYAMDPPHIHLLRRAISLDTGIPPQDRVCVEVGSFYGRSTTAFIHALQSGDIATLHIVEVRPRKPLLRLIRESGVSDRIILHRSPLWEINLVPAVNHLAFIDGDHRWPALADILTCLALEVPIIAMHDSRSFPGFANCWGSTLAANILRRHPTRHIFEDAEPRPNMKTWRGFFVSSSLPIPGLHPV